MSNDAVFRLSLLVNLPCLLRFLPIMVLAGCVPLISKMPKMTFCKQCCAARCHTVSFCTLRKTSKKSPKRGASGDAAWSVGQRSVLCRPTLHVVLKPTACFLRILPSSKSVQKRAKIPCFAMCGLQNCVPRNSERK